MAEVDSTRIAGNIGAMNALNSLNNINKQLSIHQTRLATGKRINTAADDPAGLTIATKMMSRSEGLKQALSNIGDAKNLLAVAESGLGRINDILVQMRNKAEAGASDTLGSEERGAIVTQLKAYAAQIDDIAKQTEWNGNKLIFGGYSSTPLTFQTGVGQADYTSLSGLSNMSATEANGGTGTSLQLAVQTTTNSATATDTLNIIGGSGTLNLAGAASNVNVDPLASGTYTIRVSTNSANNATTLQLLDSGGNALRVAEGVDADNLDGTGGAVKTISLGDQSDDGYTDTVDFGNGLKFTLTFGATSADEVLTAQVSFSASGSYQITDNGTAAGNDLSLTTATAGQFRSYMNYLDGKMSTVSSQLSNIGALTGRLTFKEDQVSAAQINVEAAYNRIMNANMAEEQVNASKFQILQQTATAMLAQANSAPQFLLSLFR